LAIEEHALVAAKKALNHHNNDLELLFKSKHNVEVSRDKEFVKSAFDQITKTIIDGIDAYNNLDWQVESTKANMKIAKTKMLPNPRTILKLKKCTLVDVIFEIGMFPQYALTKLFEVGAIEALYPYCCRVYVQNVCVPLSCGCRITPFACGH